MNRMKIEYFPNELLLDLFEYIDSRDLFHGFWNLNKRFNCLIRSLDKLSLNLERNEPIVITFFSNQIIHLILNTWENINLKQFPSLQSLILYQITKDQLQQIRSEFMPQLQYLSTSSIPEFTLMTQLAKRLFSNELPSIHSLDLSLVDISHLHLWHQSPSLQSINVRCNNPTLVFFILTSSPNLRYLQVHFLINTISIFHQSPSIIHHSLKHFNLLDPYHRLSFNHIHTLLALIPNVRKIYLNFLCKIPFIRFAQSLVNRLQYLKQFDCNIDDTSFDNPTNLDTIRQIHPCFQKIYCSNNELSFRTFSTK